MGFGYEYLDAGEAAVDQEGEPLQGFRNALQTQKVCDAVLASAADGSWKETGAE